jgi:tetratricopeptide (TPR) repeat protein
MIIKDKKTLIADWYVELAEQDLANHCYLAAEKHLLLAIEKVNNHHSAIIHYGNLLIEQRRFIEAQKLLAQSYKQAPNELSIGLLYHMTLRRQGLLPECIRLCLTLLAAHPNNHYLKSELAIALVMTGNIDAAIALEKKGVIPTLRWQQWSPVAYLAKKDNKNALAVLTNSLDFINDVSILRQLLIQTLASENKEKGIAETAAKFIELSNYDQRNIWLHFELLRYFEINDEINVFDQPCEISLALTPTPYCPRATGLSHIIYDKGVISSLQNSYVAPAIKETELADNINSFRTLCRTLIKEGAFSLFQHNIAKIKARYAPETPDFVQVLSTGRCGTLALYEFLKQAKQVTPYHTMHAQMIPPDRNHIMYRIISGNFDKTVVKEILTTYLTNRVAEICYAYTQKTTPVIINHWDTIFAPFMAELFPTSKFLHLWRADPNVFESIYGKNQFQNEQLRHCYFDVKFTDGQFSCFFDDKLTMEQQISWYLYFTRVYAYAFKSTLSTDRMISLQSEDLFTANIAQYNQLKSIMPIDDISEQDFIRAFSTPINQKKEKLQLKNTELSERAKQIPLLVQQLAQYGHFQ